MTPFLDDADFTLYVGDVREQLAGLPDESVHCVVTSPPYWGLRDYSVEGQLGLEPTPDLYVQNMVAVFREVRRVLRRDGTCFVNMGDSFLPGKQLAGVPWRLAFALQDDGWIIRSDIIWSKPNPMPESVTDRPTKAHEYLFLLTRSPRYYFDAEAVREPAEYGFRLTRGGNMYDRVGNGASAPQKTPGVVTHGGDPSTGRNVRSVWEIATQPYPEAHFATFPEELPRRCISAGTSERGCCPECGAPWERQVDKEFLSAPTYKDAGAETTLTAGRNRNVTRMGDGVRVETTGWRPSCECRKPGTAAYPYPLPSVPCTVLDPFMGSGTTALVARKLGRRSIGVELNREYAELCARRLSQQSLFA